MPTSTRWLWLVLMAILLVSPAVFSQTVDDATRAAARTLGYAGVEAYQAGNYEAASTKLEKAYGVLKAPTLGLWSARALQRTGKFVEASERYLEVTRLKVTTGDVSVQKQAQAEAADEQAKLLPRIPTLRVSIEGAPTEEVQITLDGETFASALVGEAVPVNPGRHLLEASYRGQTLSVKLESSEGSQGSKTLRFTGAGTSQAPFDPTGGVAGDQAKGADPAQRADSGSATPTLGWISLGVGGVALAVGGGFALSASQDRNYLRGVEGCDLERNECPNSQRDRVDSYNDKRIYSGVGLIGGGALAALGVVLLLIDSNDSESSVGMSVGPGRMLLHGRF